MPITKPTITAIRVRMYCQGFGDCFLLSFLNENDKPVANMLIDCGVLLGTPNGNQKVKNVAAHVKATIEAESGEEPACLDYLLGTHEHWDHLSGFVVAQDVFDKIHVQNICLSWLEKNGNPIAEELQQDRKTKIAALTNARQQLTGMVADRIEDMLGFFGVGSGNTTADALKYLKNKPEANINYWESADKPISLAKNGLMLDGFRVYVLGPPTNKEDLTRSDSSQKDVLYRHERMSFLDATPSRFSFWNGLNTDSQTEADRLLFPGVLLDGGNATTETVADTKPASEYAETAPVGQTMNQIADQPTQKMLDRYNQDEWRKIDTDWLNGADSLALKLDEDTNNTSLAIAIESTKTGKVLLFPADAQVGNWQSWQKLSWQVDGKTVTMNDLFARTVFYKVGHHGSHNATLKTDGLEKMKNPELVAMVPHEKIMVGPDKKQIKWPSIPDPNLHKALLTNTKNRLVVVGDWADWHAWKQNIKAPLNNPEITPHNDLSSDDWLAFHENLVPGEGFGPAQPDLKDVRYVDYTVRF
jgi:hypothetical protein